MNSLPISIIMPVYNSENYIAASVEAILDQLFGDFELIVIDQWSTDNTLASIKTYNDPRIKIITHRYDLVGSLNRGILISEGEFITCVDQGDIMLPHKLYEQYHFMRKNREIDVLGSWRYNFGDILGPVRAPSKHTDIMSEALLNNPMYRSTVLMRRRNLEKFTAFNENKLFDTESRYVEDYRLWTSLIINDFKFANISAVQLKSRIGKEQKLSKDNLKEKWY